MLVIAANLAGSACSAVLSGLIPSGLSPCLTLSSVVFDFHRLAWSESFLGHTVAGHCGLLVSSIDLPELACFTRF